MRSIGDVRRVLSTCAPSSAAWILLRSGSRCGPGGSVDAAQDAQAAGGAHEAEPAALERRTEDLLVRRSAPVGRVGEHVVDRERAADHHVRRPALVVEPGRLLAVAAVDEQEGDAGCASARPPSATDRRRRSRRPRGRRRGSCGGRTAGCPSCRSPGRRRSGSWCSQPAWFSSLPRWWSTANTTVPHARAAPPSHTVDRPQYEPTSRNGRPGRRRPAATAASYSASPSSGGMNPLAAERVGPQRQVEGHDYQRSQWMIVSGSAAARPA